jgi:hypothetical protein
MSRFPGLIWAGEEGTVVRYEVFMTGTPPATMRWKLSTLDADMGIIVVLKYPDA